MAGYIALFCPHCHAHVNEDELLNDHDLTAEEVERIRHHPRYGSLYTCGWCKEQTRDWKHVIACRSEHNLSPQQQAERHFARGKDVQRLLVEMETEADG